MHTPTERHEASPTHLNRNFPVTRWTLIQRACAKGPDSSQAVAELCAHYWFPIYAYLRGRRFSKHDAEDLTQGFFQKLLTDELFTSADQEKGRLRSLLMSVLKCFLADRARHDMALKRGGAAVTISVDWALAEERYLAEPIDYRDPETIYLAAWARSLVEAAREKLRESYGTRAEIYTALEPFLDEAAGRLSYPDIARRLNISELAARGAVHRLRKRFGELVEEEVRQTVESDEEMKAELAWLAETLRGR